MAAAIVFGTVLLAGPASAEPGDCFLGTWIGNLSAGAGGRYGDVRRLIVRPGAQGGPPEVRWGLPTEANPGRAQSVEVSDTSIRFIAPGTIKIEATCSAIMVSGIYTWVGGARTATFSLTKQQLADAAPTTKELHDDGWRYVDGNGVAKDPEKGIALIRQAAEQGYAPSQGNLAWFYRDGLHGLPKSDADAFKWATEAHKNGFASAGSELGTLYRDGRGVPKDAARAAQLFEECANAGGTPWCARNLGLLYRDGNGVPQDKAKAKEWLGKAAAAGNKLAEQELAKLQ